jgi:hypothetical protein
MPRGRAGTGSATAALARRGQRARGPRRRARLPVDDEQAYRWTVLDFDECECVQRPDRVLCDASLSSNSRAWRAATHAPPFVAEVGVTEPAARALCLVRCDRERGAPRPLQTGRMRQSWSRAGATSGGAAEDQTCRVVGWSSGEHGGRGEGRLRHRGRQEPGAGQAARPPTGVRVSSLWPAMSTPRRAVRPCHRALRLGREAVARLWWSRRVAMCGW